MPPQTLCYHKTDIPKYLVLTELTDKHVCLQSAPTANHFRNMSHAHIIRLARIEVGSEPHYGRLNGDVSVVSVGFIEPVLMYGVLNICKAYL